ncbi:MAG: transporter [Desulfobulbus propionicus]|nr:MAG: transporter [Desulfobulbus propionicus]
MKNKQLLLALAGVLFILLGKQSAFSALPTPQVWTPPEAVQFALKHSPDAKAAQLRIEAAQAQIQQARSAFYPQLGLVGEYTRTNNPMYSFGNILNQGQFNNSMDFNDPGTSDSLQLKALLQYRFYNGGSDQAGLEMAAANKQASELTHQAIRSALGYEVIRAFYTIVQAEETVQARESAVASLKASLNVAQARFNEGDLLKNEVVNLKVQHALARENLIQAQHGLALAQRGFLKVLGLSEGVVAIDPGGNASQPVPEQPELSNRAEIKAMQSAIQALEAGVRKAQAGNYPTAEAFGSYLVEQGFELDEGSGNSWMAGMRVNYTLFNGNRTQAEITHAKLQLAEAREKLRKLELAFNYEIEQATLGLEQAEKRVQVTSQMVESAMESARLSRARFKEGLLLSSELIDTENRLTDAQLRHALANAERHIAVADLRRAAGLGQYPQQ